MKEERDRKRQEERDRGQRQKEGRGGQLQLMFVGQKQKAAAAKLQAGLRVKNSTKRKTHKRDQRTLNSCRAWRYLVFNGSKPLSIAHDTFHRI